MCGRALVLKVRGNRPLPANFATLDHIIPVARGGETTVDNLVLACKACNNERGDTPIEDLPFVKKILADLLDVQKSTSYNKNTNGAVPHRSVTKQEQATGKTMTQPAPASPTAGMYNGIDQAKTDTRFPWFDKPGRYLVVGIGWRAQKNFSGKFADVWDVEVLKTFRGEAQPGEKYTRMRTQDQWGTWLNEVKTRAVTMLTIANNGVAVAPSSIDVNVLTSITSNNGSAFYGLPVIVEVLPPKKNTRSPGEFTQMNYFIPTQADLDGANVEFVAPPVVAAPTPAPVVVAPVVAQAAPAELDDFGTLLSLGWSEAEINGLDDIAFCTAVDGKVVRSTVTLSANGQSFAAAAPARRSRVAPGASA
jgi:hypothetical protein